MAGARSGQRQNTNIPISENLFTTFEVPQYHIHHSINQNLAQDIRDGKTQFTRQWVLDKYQASWAVSIFDAYLLDIVSGKEAAKCQASINVSAHTNFLEILIQSENAFEDSSKVSLKLNPQALRSLKATDVSKQNREMLPQEAQTALNTMSPDGQHRVELLESEETALEPVIPILVDVRYDVEAAAQERIHVGTPIWAQKFVSNLLKQQVHMIIRGNSRTVQLLDSFWKICAYQIAYPPHSQWTDILNNKSGSVQKLTRNPIEPLSLDKYRYQVGSTFHSWNDYATIMSVGPLLEQRLRKESLDRYGSNEKTLRLVEIPESARRAYFGFIPLPEEELRINPSTIVNLSFLDQQEDKLEDDWFAKVAEAIPFGPDGTLPLLITRRFKVRGRHQKIKDAPDGDISKIDLSGERVKILVQEPDKTISQNRRALSQLKPEISQSDEIEWRIRTRRVLIGQNLHRLERVDLFEDIRGEFENPESIMTLNQAQVRAVQAAAKAPGGFQFIQGPPGTGKTHYAIQIAKAFFMAKTFHQLFVVSQANKSVDTLAKGLEKQLRVLQFGGHTDHSRFVLRLHARGSEMSVSKNQARDPLSKTSKLKHAAGVGSVTSMANYLASCYRKQLETKYEGISDRRVQELELSAGWRMLQIAGVEHNADITDKDPSRWLEFRRLHKKLVRDAPFNKKLVSYEGIEEREKERNIFEAECKNLYKATLQRASAIVMTVSNAGSEGVLAAIQDYVSLVIFDEAGREREDNILPILAANFTKVKGMITIGDPQQLKPRVDCSKENNPFSEQLELSFLERMTRIGFDLFTFTLQFRMIPQISAIPNTLTYQNLLEDADSVQISQRPIAQRFGEDVCKLSGKVSNILFRDVIPGAVNKTLADHTRSRYNELFIMLILENLIDLLKRHQDASIAVLTAYTAQSSRLETGLKQMETLGIEGASKVHVGRFDGEQGEEYDIVILDLLVADTVGFLSDERRMNVAMSRARDGLIVFADSNCIDNATGEAPYLRELMEILRGCMVKTKRFDQFPKCDYYQPDQMVGQPAQFTLPVR